MRAHVLVGLVLLTVLLPPTGLAQSEASPTVTIHMDWEGGTAIEAGLLQAHLSFSSPITDPSGITVQGQHIHPSGDQVNVTTDLQLDAMATEGRLNISTSSLAEGSSLTLTVLDGGVGIGTRQFTLGIWNQPTVDHEVALETNWDLRESSGQGRYDLTFQGRGWQIRSGATLEAWELGNGTLSVLDDTDMGRTSIELALDRIWRNESTVEGLLASRTFAARGSGTIMLDLTDASDGLSVNGTVHDALFNRSMVDGTLSEHVRVDASGDLVTSMEDDEEQWNISGEVGTLFFETIDQDGNRTLQHTELEASGRLIAGDVENRLDVDLDRIRVLERWEEGVRTEQHFLLLGDGTFGFNGEGEAEQDVWVNGTVHAFESEVRQGLTLRDHLHVDGVIQGNASGTFGVLRDIEETSTATNSTGVEHDVVVIHDQNWFNLTGVGRFGFEGLSAGAHHNQTWSYDVVQAEYENRTVYRRWQTTGPDADVGETFPPRSPIVVEPVAPSPDPGLGSIDLPRESGWVAIPAVQGDRFVLDATPAAVLTVTIGSEGTDVREGRDLDVVRWDGVYADDRGNATGSLVRLGPLSGLLGHVNRSFSLGLEDLGRNLTLTEEQAVGRILAPAVVASNENTAPSIDASESGIREGLVVNEFGSLAHLEVMVVDAESNVERVEADLTGLGIGIDPLSLSDRGTLGDERVLDDVWTLAFEVPSTVHGPIIVPVVVVDAFGEVSRSNLTIQVDNQPPRLVSYEASPNILGRGETVILNLGVVDGNGVASVQIDLRQHGGGLIDLNRAGQTWNGPLEVPSSMPPGVVTLPVLMVDNAGASITVERTQSIGLHGAPSELDVPITVTIRNTPPDLANFTAGDGIIILPGSGSSQHLLTIEASDPDGVNAVRIRLNDLAPPGRQTEFLPMRDDGTQGDRIAGDGVYSIQVTVGANLPTSGHSVEIIASDLAGEIGLSATFVVQVQPPSTSTVDDASSTLEGSLVPIGLLLVLLVVGGLAFMTLRGRDGEGGFGGFGDA